MKVAIHRKINEKLHSGSWTTDWEQFVLDNNIEYEFVDCFQSDIMEQLRNFDCLLWHFDQYNFTDMLAARSILYSAKSMGLSVFPDFNETWHFDDKVAEMYALQAINAPIPKSFVFYDLSSFDNWLKSKPTLPIVGKLRTGSGSHNVNLLKSEYQLKKYAKRMLSKGYNPAPNLVYKTSSNIRSSHDWEAFKKKFKRIPEFLRVLSGAKKFSKEHGYVYLQEFIPNEGYDMKVVVVGDKLSGFVRPVRSNDFRASGGGECFFDKKYFTEPIIKSAFQAADVLNTQCIGFDYVVDKNTGEGLIVEMSYGFSNPYVMSSNGYFDRNCNWHDEPLNAPVELLKNMMK